MNTATRKFIITSIFSLFIFLVIMLGIFIPVYGTDIIIDPGEIFITLGAVFGGTAGAVVIALSRTAAKFILHPGWMQFSSGVAHVAAAIFIGRFYRLAVKKNRSSLKQLYLWTAALVIYYFLLIIPIFNFINYAILKEQYSSFFGLIYTGPWQPLILLIKAASPEFLFTSFATSVIIFSIPPGYRES